MSTFDAEEEGRKADELLSKYSKETDDEPLEDAEDIQDDSLTIDVDWENKFRVLQGKYNTELSRLSDALTIAETERAKLAAKGAPASLQAAIATKISDTEDAIATLRRLYPDVYEGFNAIVKREVETAIKPAEERVGERIQSAEHVRFMEKLDKEIPDWRKINEDPKFAKWLEAIDRYTGAPKRNILLNVYNSRNLESTKAFFEDYLEGTGGGETTKVERHTLKREDTFDDIAPATSSGSPVTGKGTPKIVTRAEIKKFYEDRASNRWVGSEEDAVKMEQRFINAHKEGRVR